jgi:hypothetical protein
MVVAFAVAGKPGIPNVCSGKAAGENGNCEGSERKND